jgi:hypothetical protein
MLGSPPIRLINDGCRVPMRGCHRAGRDDRQEEDFGIDQHLDDSDNEVRIGSLHRRLVSRGFIRGIHGNVFEAEGLIEM